MAPRVRWLTILLVAALFVVYAIWSQRAIAQLREQTAQLQAETEVLGRMLEELTPVIGQFPMPIVIGFDGSATDLDPPSEIKLWTWDYPMLVGLFAEAFAGLGESLGDIGTVPFADPRSIPDGAKYVWAEFQPPAVCELGKALEARKLALWSGPNTGQSQLYVCTSSGSWYGYSIRLSPERLTQYRDSVHERNKSEP